MAAAKDHVKIMGFLMDNYIVDPNTPIGNGRRMSLALYAIAKGHINVATKVLNESFLQTKTQQLNTSDTDHPLRLAILTGQQGIVELVLQKYVVTTHELKLIAADGVSMTSMVKIAKQVVNDRQERCVEMERKVTGQQVILEQSSARLKVLRAQLSTAKQSANSSLSTEVNKLNQVVSSNYTKLEKLQNDLVVLNEQLTAANQSKGYVERLSKKSDAVFETLASTEAQRLPLLKPSDVRQTTFKPQKHSLWSRCKLFDAMGDDEEAKKKLADSGAVTLLPA